MGGCAGCEEDSQFDEKVTSFEPTCMNTTSEVTSVVFTMGLKPACMNTTSKVTSAVSVVHWLLKKFLTLVRTLVGMVT